MKQDSQLLISDPLFLGIEELNATYGGQPASGFPHLSGHHIRARSVACRWLKTMHHVEQPEEIEERAKVRVKQGLAPAKRSGSGDGDSIIFESYLHTIQELRNSGCMGSAVFVSSNTKDYLVKGGSKSETYHEITQVMKPLNFRYAKDYETAAALLGV